MSLRVRSHTPEANTNVLDNTRIECETKTIHHCGLPVVCHLVENSATEVGVCDFSKCVFERYFGVKLFVIFF